jgi:hypothetical protein
MNAVFKGVVAATVLAGSSLAVAAPAQARYHHGNGNAAIVAGIVGLGVGAAIASDNGYGRSGGYYGYDNGPDYYAPAYYDGGYSYGYAQPYYGGYSYGYDRRDYGRGHRDWDRRGHDNDRGHRGRDRDDRGDRGYRR